MSAGRKINSLTQEWNTPPKYIDLIYKFFGGVPNLDPCSNENSLVNAEINWILPTNGLLEEWNYKTIYVNPPYGRNSDKTTIKDWIKKGYESYQKYNNELLYLIPVATNTRHWKDYIFGKSSICFLYDTRLKFYYNGLEVKKGAPMSCSMIYYGQNINKFKEIFNQSGYIIN